MPTLTHTPYADIIRLLPVDDHTIEVDAKFWAPIFTAAGQAPLHAAIFGGHATIGLSRNRLKHFAYATPEQKCAEILLWGYPRNPRGVAARALANLPTVALAAAAMATWPAYNAAFPKGVGLSTTTKLAYFFGHTFGGYPALILDDKVISALGRWHATAGLGVKRSQSSARRFYVAYLKAVHNASLAIGCSEDAVEFFLFTLGQCFR